MRILEEYGSMALESTHNSKIMLVVLCMLAVIFLFGCDGKYGKYPYDKATQWECSDPEFSIEWASNEYGLITGNSSIINWKAKETLVYVEFYSSFFEVLPSGSNHHDYRLLTGTWKYRNGDLILIIKEDFIFDNQYEELVFSPVT